LPLQRAVAQGSNVACAGRGCLRRCAQGAEAAAPQLISGGAAARQGVGFSVNDSGFRASVLGFSYL